MSLNKWGLILNLIGSIFLGTHIIGLERLKSWEDKIKNLPKKVSEGIFIAGISIVTKTNLKRQSLKWPGGPKKWGLELKKNLQIGFDMPRDWPKVKRNQLLYPFLTAFYLGLIAAAVLWIALLPLILSLLIVTRPFALIQKQLKLESFWGLIGILLLITGFILQIID
jgi:hypothetical protein